MNKTLLFSSTSIGENFEGLCLGPQLANGNFSLLGIADDGDPVTGNTLVALELVTVVPEPHAWMLAAAGGAGLAVLLALRKMLKRSSAAAV